MGKVTEGGQLLPGSVIWHYRRVTCVTWVFIWDSIFLVVGPKTISFLKLNFWGNMYFHLEMLPGPTPVVVTCLLGPPSGRSPWWGKGGQGTSKLCLRGLQLTQVENEQVVARGCGCGCRCVASCVAWCVGVASGRRLFITMSSHHILCYALFNGGTNFRTKSLMFITEYCNKGCGGWKM